MREEGVVIDTYGEFAKVEAKRSASCEGCSGKDACRPDGNASMIIEVINSVNARVGDRICFEVEGSILLKSTFIIYLMPVIFLLIGAWAGGEISKIYFKREEIISVISGIIFFLASIFILISLNSYFSKNKSYKPAIKEILQS
jgi:sigma-E factor negative regulatory protein RseC